MPDTKTLSVCWTNTRRGRLGGLFRPPRGRIFVRRAKAQSKHYSPKRHEQECHCLVVSHNQISPTGDGIWDRWQLGACRNFSIGNRARPSDPYDMALTTHVKFQRSGEMNCTLCLKNDTCVIHITSTHINRFWQFLAVMLLRELAIKCRFAIPHLLTNVSALPGETLTWTPEIVLLQSCCIPCLGKRYYCIFDSSTNFNNFCRQ